MYILYTYYIIYTDTYRNRLEMNNFLQNIAISAIHLDILRNNYPPNLHITLANPRIMKRAQQSNRVKDQKTNWNKENGRFLYNMSRTQEGENNFNNNKQI